METVQFLDRGIRRRAISGVFLAVSMLPCTSMAGTFPKKSNSDLYLEKFQPHKETIVKTLDAIWPDIPMRSFIPALIEQETCISPTHRMCWNSRAELKTAREYGFGMSQTTIAYRADGSERFNVWKELTNLDPVLKSQWTWENRYSAEMQIRSIVIKNRINYSTIRFETASVTDKMAFTAVWYNSGNPLIDRNICVRTPGCDPSKWFGNVELYTRKSVIKQKGYGKSFAEISREYPRQILITRRPKYLPYFGN